MDSPTSRIPTYAVGILFLVEKNIFCYHRLIIHHYIYMPGGKFENAFDVSDNDEMSEAEKARKTAEIKAEAVAALKDAKIPKEQREMRALLDEISESKDVYDLADEDIEIIPDEVDLQASIAEDGTEMKTLLKEIQEDVHGTSEINQAMRDLKSVLAETPKENIAAVGKEITKPIEITDDMMVEEEPITLEESDIQEITEPDVEMTADYESDTELMAENEQKIANLKKERDAVNKVLLKNPAAWGLQNTRIANIQKEISALEASNDKIKNSIVDLDDYRQKKNKKAASSAGGTRAAA